MTRFMIWIWQRPGPNSHKPFVVQAVKAEKGAAAAAAAADDIPAAEEEEESKGATRK